MIIINMLLHIIHTLSNTVYRERDRMVHEFLSCHKSQTVLVCNLVRKIVYLKHRVTYSEGKAEKDP